MEQRSLSKRFYRIALGTGVWSLAGIAVWYIIGFLYQDIEIANTFVLTYPFQFVWMSIDSIFGNSAFASAYKKSDEAERNNHILSAMLFGSLAYLSIHGLCFWLFPWYCRTVGFLDSKYVMWGRFFLIRQAFAGLMKLLYIDCVYKKEDKKARKVFVLDSTLEITVVTVTLLFTKNIYVVYITSTLEQLVLMFWLIRGVWKKFKLRFDTEWFKIALPEVTDNILNTVFHFVGTGYLGNNAWVLVFIDNLDTSLSDYLWDIKCIGFVELIRSEVVRRDNSRKTLYKMHRLWSFIVQAIFIAEVVSCTLIFDLDVFLVLLVTIPNNIHMLSYAYEVIYKQSAVCFGFEKFFTIIDIVKWVLKYTILTFGGIIGYLYAGCICSIFANILVEIHKRRHKNEVFGSWT